MKEVATFHWEIPESVLHDFIKGLEEDGLKRTTKPIGCQIDIGEYRVTETPSEFHLNQRKVDDKGVPLWSIVARKE